jgi:hypothetical protein
MNKRFPNIQRVTWRQRFVAIARQSDPACRAAATCDPMPRRKPDPLIRVRFAALSSHLMRT